MTWPAYALRAASPSFGKPADVKPAPRDAVRKRYGRVRFGHSELSGFQLWDTACDEGERAVRQVMELI